MYVCGSMSLYRHRISAKHTWSLLTRYILFRMTKANITEIFSYPLLICGPHAANLAKKLSPEQGLPVVIGGFILQGIGFMVSLMVYSAFLYRLMTQKLPKESLRPAMFISVVSDITFVLSETVPSYVSEFWWRLEGRSRPIEADNESV